MKRPGSILMNGMAAAMLASLLFISCEKQQTTAPSTNSIANTDVLAKPDATPRTYLLGTGGIEGPDIAEASNGDTIAIIGTGTLTPMPKAVTGSGTFVHKDASGVVLAAGTWTAVQLITFVSYGTLPPPNQNFEGGTANIRVHLTPSSGGGVDAVLQVHCLIGSPPSGVDEGIRLNVQGGPNFNREVHGETLFILP
jgi:hypothetical protein